ncbi:MAG: hypothetical protein ACM335_09335 [Deltaproteobacteria bacterium]
MITDSEAFETQAPRVGGKGTKRFRLKDQKERKYNYFYSILLFMARTKNGYEKGQCV